MVRVCKQAGGETGGLSLIWLIEGHVIEVNYWLLLLIVIITKLRETQALISDTS
jgi:hypothetical protein